MNKTKIEWVKNPDGSQGFTWNPITGCLNGCLYCYARKLAHGRLIHRYLANKNLARWHKPTLGEYGFGPLARARADPFYPRFWPDRLVDPHSGKGKGIFAVDMGELFAPWVPVAWTGKVLAVIKVCKQHRFYLLTHQPQELIKWSPFPENVWLGVTATTLEEYRRAIVGLAPIKAKVKYISFEPLLEEIPMRTSYSFVYDDIDWVIIGAQTRPYVPPQREWVEEILAATSEAGIPVFLKDNLYPLLPCMKETRGLFYAKNRLGELRQEMPNG